MKTNTRILGFDIARAFAILGMMFVNYKVVFTYNKVDHVWANNFISLFEGRAVAVFLVLAGIGIGLMTKKAYENKQIDLRMKDRLTLVKRAIYLFVLGAALYIGFEWSADILHYYGVFMVMIVFFLYLKPKVLFVSASGFIGVGFVLQMLLDYNMGWDAGFTFYSGMLTFDGFMANTFFNGYHPVFPWFAFLLIGLALSRLNIQSEKVQKVSFTVGLITALTIETLSIGLVEFLGRGELAMFLFDTKPMNPTMFYVLAASGWAVAFISGILLLSQKYKEHPIAITLASTGQMALTHYIGHVVLVLGVFSIWDGMAYKNEIFVLILSLVVFKLMVVFTLLWKKINHRGPYEWIMRKVAG